NQVMRLPVLEVVAAGRAAERGDAVRGDLLDGDARCTARLIDHAVERASRGALIDAEIERAMRLSRGQRDLQRERVRQLGRRVDRREVALALAGALLIEDRAEHVVE